MLQQLTPYELHSDEQAGTFSDMDGSTTYAHESSEQVRSPRPLT